MADIHHAYHLRFILKGVAEVSQKFLQDAHVLPFDGMPLQNLLKTHTHTHTHTHHSRFIPKGVAEASQILL
jgi:hypothetical protein